MSNITLTQISKKHKNQLGLIDPTVAGIDIGDKSIYVSFPDKLNGVIVKSFETTTPALHHLVQELIEYGVETAVMEATGIYWVPLYDIIEETGLKAVLVDAKSVKNVPGRKTDVLDCQWIQTLYSNGLLRAAFRPPKDRIPLREIVRHRANVIKDKQQALGRIEKTLQLMNIKLSTVVSEIGGVSGMEIIRSIVQGEKDPFKLASLRNKACKKPEKLFIDALTGNFKKEQLFKLKQQLQTFDFAHKLLEECDKEIKSILEAYPDIVETAIPVRDKDRGKNKNFSLKQKPNRNNVNFDVREILWRKSGLDFTALPGIEANTALSVFAELGGVSVDSWKSSKEFCSWLKLCPGNDISGNKRRKSKKQPSSNPLNQALRMAVLSAKRSNGYVGAYIRRISARADKPKGIKAGAHKLADLIYHMCKQGWAYHERGEEYYDKMQKIKQMKSLKKKAQDLGYDLIPKKAA